MKPSKEELMAKSEKTITELAFEYGCTKQNVSLWLKSYGLERRNITVSPDKKKNFLPMPPKEELEYLTDLTILDICEIYHVSTSTVLSWYERYGITKKDLRVNNRRREIPSKEDLEKVKNETLTEIGKKYGACPSLVRKWFIRYGIERKDKIEIPSEIEIPSKIEIASKIEIPTKIEMPSKEELLEHYDMGSKKIAELYKVNIATVWKWFKEYGLTRTKVKEKEEFIEPPKAIDTNQMRLDLVNKILNASDSFLTALNTLLERK